MTYVYQKKKVVEMLDVDKMSQTEIAKKLEISQSQVSRIAKNEDEILKKWQMFVSFTLLVHMRKEKHFLCISVFKMVLSSFILVKDIVCTRLPPNRIARIIA